MTVCPKCGSSNIDNTGHMTGRGRVIYYPGSAKVLARGNQIIACSCNDCGYIELYKEIKK